VLAILFDPQTAGGFLFGVAAADAERCVEALRQAGAPQAAVIGTVLGPHEGSQPPLRLVGALP